MESGAEIMTRLSAAITACLFASIALAQDSVNTSDFKALLDEHWQRAQQEQIFF